MMVMEQPAAKSERLSLLCRAVAATAAVETAEQLGVFAALETNPAQPPELADRLALNERGTVLLLNVLTELGVLAQDERGVFRSAVPQPASLKQLLADWRDLAEALRSDPARAMRPTVTGAREPRFRFSTLLLAPIAALTAKRLATRLEPMTHQKSCHILTMPGETLWSVALAERIPGCRITIWDRHDTLVQSDRTIKAAGYADRFEYTTDICQTDPDRARSAYDLVLGVGLDQIDDLAGHSQVLQQVFRSLRPGGLLALVEVLAREGSDGPLPLVLYALELFLRTGQSQVHPFSRYAGWLHDAGFELLEPYPLSEEPPLTLLTARRPRS
ncbi:MAG: hypothetical protein M0Z53_14410 [Thermaerobacter sp.]|nr:hypothetical protein [Thermaerobacter sp.]